MTRVSPATINATHLIIISPTSSAFNSHVQPARRIWRLVASLSVVFYVLLSTCGSLETDHFQGAHLSKGCLVWVLLCLIERIELNTDWLCVSRSPNSTAMVLVMLRDRQLCQLSVSLLLCMSGVTLLNHHSSMWFFQLLLLCKALSNLCSVCVIVVIRAKTANWLSGIEPMLSLALIAVLTVVF